MASAGVQKTTTGGTSRALLLIETSQAIPGEPMPVASICVHKLPWGTGNKHLLMARFSLGWDPAHVQTC